MGVRIVPIGFYPLDREAMLSSDFSDLREVSRSVERCREVPDQERTGLVRLCTTEDWNRSPSMPWPVIRAVARSDNRASGRPWGRLGVGVGCVPCLYGGGSPPTSRTTQMGDERRNVAMRRLFTTRIAETTTMERQSRRRGRHPSILRG